LLQAVFFHKLEEKAKRLLNTMTRKRGNIFLKKLD